MITIVELLILGFASYRGTQLAVHDSILDPARDRLFAWHEGHLKEVAPSPEDATATPSESASSSRSRIAAKAGELLITLISCTYCMGWWISGAILATYLLAAGQWHGTPLLVHGVEWLAVAGGQALLNRWDDTLGHQA